MREMNYISSKNICYMICDILRLIDERPIDHGMRVAYMLMKLLENKGSYDEYEVAEFLFLAMIHDIGTYKVTDFSKEKLDYDEEKNSNAHAVYGSLFLKNVSPFERRSDIILYHHMPYQKINRMNYEYGKIAMYLSLLEDVDREYLLKGTEIDCHKFEEEVGIRYFPEAVMLLLRCIRREGMLEKLANQEYEKELSAYMDNILFTNEEKHVYLQFVARCLSFKELTRTAETLMCGSIVDVVAESMGLLQREKEKIYYAALMHDIGMLKIEKELLEAPRELSEEERAKIETHVTIGDEILEKYFREKAIPEIAADHHERLDGSGYPKKRRETEISLGAQILQVADCATAMLNKRKYRPAMKKSEIIGELLGMADRKKLNMKIIECFSHSFETIDRKIQAEAKEFVELHTRINNKYKMVMDSNIGMEV